jgi:hypothetical protein
MHMREIVIQCECGLKRGFMVFLFDVSISAHARNIFGMEFTDKSCANLGGLVDAEYSPTTPRRCANDHD